jgi:hypothetical protein
MKAPAACRASARPPEGWHTAHTGVAGVISARGWRASVQDPGPTAPGVQQPVRLLPQQYRQASRGTQTGVTRVLTSRREHRRGQRALAAGPSPAKGSNRASPQSLPGSPRGHRVRPVIERHLPSASESWRVAPQDGCTSRLAQVPQWEVTARTRSGRIRAGGAGQPASLPRGDGLRPSNAGCSLPQARGGSSSRARRAARRP